MKISKMMTLALILAIPIAALVYISLNRGDQSAIKESKPALISNDAPALEADQGDEKYKDQYVIFFAPNMAEAATQKIFFDQHPNVIKLADGNFPGVVVVRVNSDVPNTIADLRTKDYIDLIIKNQDGLDCHSNPDKENKKN